MPKKQQWYEVRNVLSYNKKYNFVDGIRGHGKTFAFKEFTIDRFLKSGRKTVWVRYNETQKRDARDDFIVDIIQVKPEKYVDILFETKGDSLFINGEEAVRFRSITKGAKSKSVVYPEEYDLVVFDEYITEFTATEDVKFVLIFFETIERMRDYVRYVFLGNAITRNNPYLKIHGIKVADIMKHEFVQTGSAVMHSDLYAEEFKKKKKATKSGQMQMKHGYGAHSIDGDYLLDDYTKVTGAKSRKKRLLFIITDDKQTADPNINVAVWETTNRDKEKVIWCSDEVINMQHKTRFNINVTDERSRNIREFPRVKQFLSYHAFNGSLFYHTMKSQETIRKVLR